MDVVEAFSKCLQFNQCSRSMWKSQFAPSRISWQAELTSATHGINDRGEEKLSEVFRQQPELIAMLQSRVEELEETLGQKIPPKDSRYPALGSPNRSETPFLVQRESESRCCW